MKSHSLKISLDGKQAALSALNKAGINKSILAKREGIARSTVTNFFSHKPIDFNIFVKLCESLQLNWTEVTDQEVADLSLTVAFKIIVFPITGILAVLTKILFEKSVNIISISTEITVNNKYEIYIIAKINNFIKNPPSYICDELKNSKIIDIKNTVVGDYDVYPHDEGKEEFITEFNENIVNIFRHEFPESYIIENKSDIIQNLLRRNWIQTILCGRQIKIVAKDTPGSLAEISNIISRYGCNIPNIEVSTFNDTAVFLLIIQTSKIKDTFLELIKEIKKLTYIISIEHIDINSREKILLS